MGTTARVQLAGEGTEEGIRAAADRIEQLEDRWSRFRSDSDIGRLNRSRGAPVAVHPETLDLLDEARGWWRATDGRFDPTVGEAMAAAGYDRDLGLGHGPIRVGAPSPGAGAIRLDREAGTARVAPGVQVDLGGIGKGRAVDVVAGELASHHHGLVDLGGDLRVWGGGPDGSGWPIAVDDPRDGTQLCLLGLHDGAVATSSTLVRRWSDGQRRAHHLIDPRTGRPASGSVVGVTVVAGRAAPAEVLAKAAIVAGTVAAAADVLAGHGVAALVVPARGPVTLVGDVLELCWVPPTEVR